jgi:hypothetical protein
MSLDKVHTIQLTGNQIELIICGLRDLADRILLNPQVYKDDTIPDPQDIIDLVSLAVENRDTANHIESQYLS